MRQYALNIGDVAATSSADAIVCHGLGSCIGLFIYDEERSVAGGAHIMLPGQWNEQSLTPTCFSFNAIDQLLLEMKKLGSNLNNLKAKLVGGANVFQMSTMEVGRSNTEAVCTLLAERDVTILAMEVGGDFSRTAKFECGSREVEVTSKQKKSYTLKI